MATTLKQLVVATAQTLMTTEFNSLADGVAVAASSAFDNTIAATGDGSLFWEVELNVANALAGAPTNGYGVSVWFTRQIDGTNYETASATSTTVAPYGRVPDVIFNFNALTTPGRMTQVVQAPAGVTKAVAWLNGGGRALPSSGTTLKIRPTTYQSV